MPDIPFGFQRLEYSFLFNFERFKGVWINTTQMTENNREMSNNPTNRILLDSKPQNMRQAVLPKF